MSETNPQQLDEELAEFSELMPARHFRNKYPDLHSSDGAYWTELKQRETNGLAACGAVVAIYPTNDRQRANLYVHPRKYFENMRAGARRARQR